MNVLKDISPNYSMKISIHKIEDQIYVTIIFCSNYILKSNYIFMS